MNKSYLKNSFLSALAFGVTILTPTVSTIAAEYAVVVNKTNNIEGSQEEMQQQVQRIFLKQQTAWAGNIEAFPLDREADDAAHLAFAKVVLQMNVQEISSHWLSLKQQQGQTPPRSVGASSILLKLIGRREGGMGIVSVDDLSNAPGTVKILFRFSD